ncbi:hypothetical protein [Sulfurimonas sp.]|uniref:hypothetical protein n=1 Tax=Sulfurimonas sp. TaxID=2022749 RepID=UPI003D0AEE9C
MKTNLSKLLTAVVLIGTLSTAVFADNKFGLGVGIAEDLPTIRATIDIDQDLRLEPFIGFSYADTDGNSGHEIVVGTALHLKKSINTKLKGYYGGYIGIGNMDQGTTDETNFNLGPVAGVEYAFDPKFTLGAEVSLNFGFGDTTSVGTCSSVLLRYYF